MNKSRRKLILIFSIFIGVMLAAATGVMAYSAHQMQLARFGDIFDRVIFEQAQAWVVPALIVIGGISVIGVFIFIGLFVYRGKEAADV